MKWMSRLLSGAVLAGVKFLIASVLAYYGFTSEWFHELWVVFRGYPLPLQAVVWASLAFASTAGLVMLLRMPIDPMHPDSLPKYFKFYLFPFRRISWRFERLFNSYSDYENKFLIANFPFYLKANGRRDLNPISAVIRSRVTGVSIPVALAGPPPAGGYVPASTVESCVSGIWISGVAEFSPPIYAYEFLDRFGDFDFIFEYDDHKVFRRHFSIREVENYLKNWQQFFEKRDRHSLPTVKVKA